MNIIHRNYFHFFNFSQNTSTCYESQLVSRRLSLTPGDCEATVLRHSVASLMTIISPLSSLTTNISLNRSCACPGDQGGREWVGEEFQNISVPREILGHCLLPRGLEVRRAGGGVLQHQVPAGQQRSGCCLRLLRLLGLPGCLDQG